MFNRWIRKTVARSNRNKLTNHVLKLFCWGFSQVGKLEGCLQTLKYIVEIFGDFLKMTNFKVPMGKCLNHQIQESFMLSEFFIRNF